MLESFNFRVIWEYLPMFGHGLFATAWISLISAFGAMLIGVVACMARLSHFKAVVIPAAVYIESIRSTPLLAQLYFFYFGLPSMGVRLDEYQTGIMALCLNSGAYIAEILRAGVQSIPTGHIEAGASSGLSYLQRLRYIIMPQAIGITIPPLLGQTIVLVKDSALLSLISVVELTRAGQLMNSERFMPAEGFFTTAICYLILYHILKALSSRWQKKLIYRPAV
ncbi:MAG: amino acid ABC transporter permease [Desulfatirhabdiaceae bacterium]